MCFQLLFSLLLVASAFPCASSGTCYGYTHRMPSYDVTLEPDRFEAGVAELKCCHTQSIMNLARWRILRVSGRSDQLPLCSRVGEVYFACWKYVSRLSVHLFVNVTKLREIGEATFLCGTEPMSDDEFTLTTKVRLLTPEIPTPTPGVSPSPTAAFAEEEMNPKLPDVLGASCDVSLGDRRSNGVDVEENENVQRFVQCEQRKIVTCFGNASSLRWTIGRRNRSRPVSACSIAKCIESCWKVSANEDGVELHLSRERNSNKAAFHCEMAGRDLCSFKAVWV